MKKMMTAAMALVAVLGFAEAASACTATSVMNRATQYEDTEYYDNIKTAVETDDEIQSEEWETSAAKHAAIGTVLREGYEKGTGATITEKLDSTVGSSSAVSDFLDDESFAKDAYPGNFIFDAHRQHGVETVRDHAIFHGGEWEDGVDKITGDPLPDPWPTDPRDPEQHAG